MSNLSERSPPPLTGYRAGGASSSGYDNSLYNGGENHINDYPMASPSQNSPMSSQTNVGGSSAAAGGGSAGPSSSQSNANKPTASGDNQIPLLTKPRLQELVREVDPTEQLDEEVEELLLQIADDFIDDTIKAACAFAKHRKSTKVEIRDVQLHLERKWNMWIPGFGTDELRPYKRATVTEAHKQRLALIRKTIKKY